MRFTVIIITAICALQPLSQADEQKSFWHGLGVGVGKAAVEELSEPTTSPAAVSSSLHPATNEELRDFSLDNAAKAVQNSLRGTWKTFGKDGTSLTLAFTEGDSGSTCQAWNDVRTIFNPIAYKITWRLSGKIWISSHPRKLDEPREVEPLGIGALKKNTAVFVEMTEPSSGKPERWQIMSLLRDLLILVVPETPTSGRNLMFFRAADRLHLPTLLTPDSNVPRK